MAWKMADHRSIEFWWFLMKKGGFCALLLVVWIMGFEFGNGCILAFLPHRVFMIVHAFELRDIPVL